MYKGIFRNLLVGNVYNDLNNLLKVNIVLGKKFDDEKLIDFIKENYCLLNEKLEISISFVNGEELKYETKL